MKGDPNQLSLEVDGIVRSSSLWAGPSPRFIVSKQIRGVSTADVFSSTRLLPPVDETPAKTFPYQQTLVLHFSVLDSVEAFRPVPYPEQRK